MANDTITSSRPSAGSASGVSSVPPPTLVPLPTATIKMCLSMSETTSPSASIRSRTNGGLIEDSAAPIG